MLEIVRLKFQSKWATPGRFPWKLQGEQACKSELFKVTNKGKPPQMFSLACNLTKNGAEFLPVEISSKKVRANNGDFSIIKITSKKVSENNVDFSAREITPKKARGNNVDIPNFEITSKKVRAKNVDISAIEIISKKIPSFQSPKYFRFLNYRCNNLKNHSPLCHL